MKSMFLALGAGLLFMAQAAQAQMTAQEAIKAQAGCYHVTFKFAETFPIKQGYEIRPPYRSGALEWVEVDKDENNEIHLQHVLVIGPEHSLKHWRQEWTYDASSLLSFKGDRQWQTEALPAHNHLWTQRVYQVDDSPRYSCAAPWVVWGDQAYWECQSWNPLPRREFSNRSDYNVLQRRNRHQLTSYGWVHEQDNVKLVTENAQVVEALTKEKGENTYKKVDDAQCATARQWWQDNKSVWHQIQAAWRQIYAENPTLRLKGEVDGMKLWQRLFAFADQMANEGNSAEQIKDSALTIIRTYIPSED